MVNIFRKVSCMPCNFLSLHVLLRRILGHAYFDKTNSIKIIVQCCCIHFSEYIDTAVCYHQWLFICQVRSAQFFGKILHFIKKTKLRKIRKNKPHDTRFIRFIFWKKNIFIGQSEINKNNINSFTSTLTSTQ